MSLPALRLDDLEWDDLRLLAQRRIPAASGGTWTHHAPVDPGITLLELFAFLLEQQLFVLDQVPDSLVRAVLTLLGEAPLPTGVARTLLAGNPVAGSAAALSAGMLLRPMHPELAELAYHVTTSTAVLPIASIFVEVDGRRLEPRGESAPVEVLPAGGEPALFDLVLELSGPAPADPGPLALLLELDAPSRVAPSWSAEATAVPPPASLSFASVTGAVVSALPSTSVSDETLGLRRSGLLTVQWQSSWSGATQIRLRISTAAASFASPPRIERVVANVVVASHAVPWIIDSRDASTGPVGVARGLMMEQLARWLPLSNLFLDIPSVLGKPIDGTVMLSLTRASVDVDWEEVADLCFAGPSDRQFTLDRLRGRLHFGDGYTGRVPAPAVGFRLTFLAGGGPDGNLPSGIDWLIVGETSPHLRNLINVVAAEGGREAEELADARQRVAERLARSERVVTELDARDLIETMPGVGPHRAHVAVGFDPAFPCAYVPDAVSVFVVPRVPRETEVERARVPAPTADPGAMSLFAERLDVARMLGTRFHVLTPRYRMVALEVAFRGARSEADESMVALRESLARFLDAVVGGEGEGWTFGHPLRPSELARIAQQSVGDEIFVDRVAVGIDGAEPSEDCADTTIGPHDLVCLGSMAFRRLPFEAGGQR